jgi:hypothetical protein
MVVGFIYAGNCSTQNQATHLPQIIDKLSTKYFILFYYHLYDGNANQGLGKAKLGIG